MMTHQGYNFEVGGNISLNLYDIGIFLIKTGKLLIVNNLILNFDDCANSSDKIFYFCLLLKHSNCDEQFLMSHSLKLLQSISRLRFILAV